MFCIRQKAVALLSAVSLLTHVGASQTTSDATQRLHIPCGYRGIAQEECEARGCLWETVATSVGLSRCVLLRQGAQTTTDDASLKAVGCKDASEGACEESTVNALGLSETATGFFLRKEVEIPTLTHDMKKTALTQQEQTHGATQDAALDGRSPSVSTHNRPTAAPPLSTEDTVAQSSPSEAEPCQSALSEDELGGTIHPQYGPDSRVVFISGDEREPETRHKEESTQTQSEPHEGTTSRIQSTTDSDSVSQESHPVTLSTIDESTPPSTTFLSLELETTITNDTHISTLEERTEQELRAGGAPAPSFESSTPTRLTESSVSAITTMTTFNNGTTVTTYENGTTVTEMMVVGEAYGAVEGEKKDFVTRPEHQQVLPVMDWGEEAFGTVETTTETQFTEVYDYREIKYRGGEEGEGIREIVVLEAPVEPPMPEEVSLEAAESSSGPEEAASESRLEEPPASEPAIEPSVAILEEAVSSEATGSPVAAEDALEEAELEETPSVSPSVAPLGEPAASQAAESSVGQEDALEEADLEEPPSVEPSVAPPEEFVSSEAAESSSMLEDPLDEADLEEPPSVEPSVAPPGEFVSSEAAESSSMLEDPLDEADLEEPPASEPSVESPVAGSVYSLGEASDLDTAVGCVTSFTPLVQVEDSAKDSQESEAPASSILLEDVATTTSTAPAVEPETVEPVQVFVVASGLTPALPILQSTQEAPELSSQRPGSTELELQKPIQSTSIPEELTTVTQVASEEAPVETKKHKRRHRRRRKHKKEDETQSHLVKAFEEAPPETRDYKVLYLTSAPTRSASYAEIRRGMEADSRRQFPTMETYFRPDPATPTDRQSVMGSDTTTTKLKGDATSHIKFAVERKRHEARVAPNPPEPERHAAGLDFVKAAAESHRHQWQPSSTSYTTTDRSFGSLGSLPKHARCIIYRRIPCGKLPRSFAPPNAFSREEAHR